MNKALTDKIIVLGVDGMDPMFAKKMIDKGKMPNLKAFVDRGAAREDLMLLGAMPTVTPPMWTTLATGAYPETHGIIHFSNPHPTKLDHRIYALDSRMCQAEPIWNVFSEAGKKTLVWHWPGSSWPPTSDNPNLYVVDGTQPGAINMGTAVVDWETIGIASEEIEEVRYVAHSANNNPEVGCVITDVDVPGEGETEAKASGAMDAVLGSVKEYSSFYFDEKDSEVETLGNVNFSVFNSPIKEAKGWGAGIGDEKEFVITTNDGLTRYPALILKNADGKYDRVAVYKTKKELEPMVTVSTEEYVPDFTDEIKHDGKIKRVNRAIRLLELAEDGSKVRFWLSIAYDTDNDAVWHPKTLYTNVVQNVGAVPNISLATGKNPEYAEKLLIASWDYYCDWQAKALTYLMQDFDVIISHLHNIDNIGHQIWHFGKHNEKWGNDEKFYQNLMEYTYEQTDRYLGAFLPALADGWSVIITSDHGLITEENQPPGLGEAPVNGTVMKELGYTVFKKNAQGEDIKEIDWTQTKALASRGYITINLKGRDEHGIVEAADKYALEEQIISDLYRYQDPLTGRRTIAMALRTKDAAVLGLNCEGMFDIAYFVEEGFNIIHMDSLATQLGYYDTSVSPIFVAAGAGIKEGYTVKRVIRQVDVAPTLAVLGGIRMPHECEGAPAYQIFSEEF